MSELPSGTVTFLFTDLEGSTRLWEEHPEAMQPALARHDEILRESVTAHRGSVVKTTGDGIHAAFATAEDAVDAAISMQRQLASTQFDGVGALRVRIGLHAGAADLRDGDYYGSSVNRAARIMSAAHGGQIAVSHATEELMSESLPDGLELVDLGEHRLRDLSRAERVFQLCAPDLPRDFPPLRSLDAFPGNLPLQLTSFVGREDELRAITKTFDSSRLVTLSGVGGVGKTRLALQVAAEALPRFRDGAWFCELAAASDTDAMAQVVASTLGVNPRQGATLEGSVVEFLGSKQLLVVLDNCEHLLGAAARLAEGILRGCPGVCVLATSREGLGIEGERNWALRSLPVPEASDASDAIEANAAVRLFVERAVDAHADFELDAAGAAAVSEICRRLDGIPLAIELAAVRSVAMSPREIAARLDERFRLLTGGRRTAVERHQTLRATVDWSYSMLGAREQVVFERLGVFAGSFDAAAAEAIAAGDDIEPWDVLDALADLVAKSMIVPERTPRGTRYQLLETMRAYARERLDSADEGDTWRRRHAEHYTAFAERAGPALVGPDELQWRPRLREELDNLRAAVTWSLDRLDTPDEQFALRIIAALAYLVNQDRPSGVGTWAERAIDLAERAEPALRAPILAAAAESARGRGDIVAARALAVDALRDGIPPSSPNTILAYVVLSVVDANLGEIERAYQEIQEGIAAAATTIGEDSFAMPVLQCVAIIFATYNGDLASARTYAQSALEAARQLGNPSLLSIALYVSGYMFEQDDPAVAAANYDEAIALIEGGAATTIYAPALSVSAILLMRGGEHAEGLRRLRASFERSHFEADMGFVISCAVSAVVVFDLLDRPELGAEFLGIATRGPLAHLSIQADESRRSLPAVVEGLQARLGDEAFEAAGALGAERNADQIVAFALASIDDALDDIDDG